MGSPYAVAAVWIGLAFASALVSTRTGIAVSLVEILVGALVGNLAAVLPSTSREPSRLEHAIAARHGEGVIRGHRSGVATSRGGSVQGFLLVCLGGAIGTGARYQLASWVARIYGAGFPRGTVLINVTGSFLIALVMDLSLRTGAIPEDVRLFLTTGMMGGYTTYSSFNYETLRLVEGGTLALATLNVALTVVGCLVSGVLGLLAARGLARLAPLLGSGG